MITEKGEEDKAATVHAYAGNHLWGSWGHRFMSQVSGESNDGLCQYKIHFYTEIC